MNEVYLDNSATTAVGKKTADKIVELLTKKYGNPSSLHAKGMEAEMEVEKAKASISRMLGCDKNEIYFTSGGTEANNIAVFGAAMKNRRLGNKIVTTQMEHSSVYESMKELENQGFEVVFLKGDKHGNITKDQVLEAVDENTILVSMMMVNNELGSILPVGDVKRCIKLKKSPAIFHVDAVQAFGKIPVKVSSLNADLITITAHKIHGPKGVGALYKSGNVNILPRTFGGDQQSKLRPGTEAVALIAGFGVAVENAFDMDESYRHVKSVSDYLLQRLGEIDGITINSPQSAIAYIKNFSVNRIKSETMLHYLSANNIYVSSGSACAKGKKSRVLSGLGLDDNLVNSAIRVSFCKYNTKDEIDVLVENLKQGMKALARY